LGLAPSLSSDEHRAALAQILGWIGAGDLYQACFTYPMWAARPPELDARAMFAALRAMSPAPFAALVVPGGPLSLAGASPERFLQVRGRVAQARPMKGTRPRLEDPLQDDAQRQDLRDSLKDRAENVMIVDLMRNDLGRVCTLGSVCVPDLFTVETYRAVHQMTSTVRGTLAPDAHALDAVRACFPPGSMTGAPKVAAMQRLQTLETSPRGWYSGALGYLGFDGDADLCVVIRSALLSQDRLAWHVGGGIVADSDFEAEWLESLSKCPPALRGS
jgi:anthranilate/para-aminobenzoate synthase component I